MSSSGTPPLDPTRLTANPFGFKRSEGEAEAYLVRAATQLYDFLGGSRSEPIPLPAFYAAWNSFAGREDELFRLYAATLSWQRVIRTTNEPALVILFGIFCIEALSRSESLEFPDWLLREPDALAALSGATPSGYMERLRQIYAAYKESHGSVSGFRQFIVEHISREGKGTLLRGFQFSSPYRLGTAPSQLPRHLHCEANTTEDGCGTWCTEPANDQVDDLTRRLATRLYDMRSAVVHRNAFVMFASQPDEFEGVVAVPIVYDAYFGRDSKIVGYSTSVATDELIRLIKGAIWHWLDTRAKEGSGTPG